MYGRKVVCPTKLPNMFKMAVGGSKTLLPHMQKHVTSLIEIPSEKSFGWKHGSNVINLTLDYYIAISIGHNCTLHSSIESFKSDARVAIEYSFWILV